MWQYIQVEKLSPQVTVQNKKLEREALLLLKKKTSHEIKDLDFFFRTSQIFRIHVMMRFLIKFEISDHQSLFSTFIINK